MSNHGTRDRDSVVRLSVLDRGIAQRCDSTTVDHPDWPCRAGCDDCCRSLAHVPEISALEWQRLRLALAALDSDARASVAAAVTARRAAPEVRPVSCPLLGEGGLCRVYAARPVACRSYGFYADRDGVLGCHRIAARAEEPSVTWGNHEAVTRGLDALGEKRSLLDWLAQAPGDGLLEEVIAPRSA